MYRKEEGLVGSSVRVLLSLFVGGMKVEQRGRLVWPLVPVQVEHPGLHPWLNHRQAAKRGCQKTEHVTKISRDAKLGGGAGELTLAVGLGATLTRCTACMVSTRTAAVAHLR